MIPSHGQCLVSTNKLGWGDNAASTKQEKEVFEYSLIAMKCAYAVQRYLERLLLVMHEYKMDAVLTMHRTRNVEHVSLDELLYVYSNPHDWEADDEEEAEDEEQMKKYRAMDADSLLELMEEKAIVRKDVVPDTDWYARVYHTLNTVFRSERKATEEPWSALRSDPLLAAVFERKCQLSRAMCIYNVATGFRNSTMRAVMQNTDPVDTYIPTEDIAYSPLKSK